MTPRPGFLRPLRFGRRRPWTRHLSDEQRAHVSLYGRFAPLRVPSRRKEDRVP